MIDSQYFSPLCNQGVELGNLQISILVDRKDFQDGALAGTEHLPGNNIGMVLGLRYDDLVAGMDKRFAEGKSDQVDGCGRTGSEYDFRPVLRMEKILDGIPRLLVRLRRLCRNMMDGTVEVGIAGFGQGNPAIDHLGRTLDSRCIVEINQRLSVYPGGQDREMVSNILYVHVLSVHSLYRLANLANISH